MCGSGNLARTVRDDAMPMEPFPKERLRNDFPTCFLSPAAQRIAGGEDQGEGQDRIAKLFVSRS
jgi:hypothetical protein